MRFPGCKDVSTQALAFPRVAILLAPDRRNDYRFYTWPSIQIDNSATVPDSVKSAQAEEALELSSPSSDTTLAAKLAKGRATASVKIGSFGETFRDNAPAALNSVQTVLKSTKAQEYIMISAGGGFRVQ